MAGIKRRSGKKAGRPSGEVIACFLKPTVSRSPLKVGFDTYRDAISRSSSTEQVSRHLAAISQSSVPNVFFKTYMTILLLAI
jgi:hypothetical protein